MSISQFVLVFGHRRGAAQQKHMTHITGEAQGCSVLQHLPAMVDQDLASLSLTLPLILSYLLLVHRIESMDLLSHYSLRVCLSMPATQNRLN